MLPFIGHLNLGSFRISCVSKRKYNELLSEAGPKMNSRNDHRIDLQLPCRLLFPKVWSGSLDGLTANLHRNGMMVACRVKPGREIPALGETASVAIELPRSDSFPPKFMRCETTLVHVEELGGHRFHFAMQITNVAFGDISPADLRLMEMDSESCGYLM